MKIYIGADHRGFALKQQLIEWLKKQKYFVEDCGNTVYDPKDDYPDFAQKVAHVVTEQQALGIVICGSGVGVSIGANRYKGIRCALGFNTDQVKDSRMHDHINMLALAADFTDIKQAQEMVGVFLTTQPNAQEKYLRRIKKLDTTLSYAHHTGDS